MDRYTNSLEPHQAEEAYSPSETGVGNQTEGAPLQEIRTFDDFQARKTYRTRINLDNPKTQQCPTTDEEFRGYVSSLMYAINDVSTVLDKPLKNGKPAQAVQRIIDGYYPKYMIEEVCWDIVTKLNQSHSGVRLVDEGYGSKKFNDYDTYTEKFYAITQALTKHKSIVKMLMDASFIDRLVDAPEIEMKSKEANSIINAKRNEQNSVGREAIKQGRDQEILNASAAARQQAEEEHAEEEQVEEDYDEDEYYDQEEYPGQEYADEEYEGQEYAE